MDSYQILRSIYKVGHPLTGKVISYNEPIEHKGMLVGGQVILETSSEFSVILTYDSLFDEKKKFDKIRLPEIGSQIKTVIKNYVDETLYVSARPCDLTEEEIQSYKEFYAFVERIAKVNI